MKSVFFTIKKYFLFVSLMIRKLKDKTFVEYLKNFRDVSKKHSTSKSSLELFFPANVFQHKVLRDLSTNREHPPTSESFRRDLREGPSLESDFRTIRLGLGWREVSERVSERRRRVRRTGRPRATCRCRSNSRSRICQIPEKKFRENIKIDKCNLKVKFEAINRILNIGIKFLKRFVLHLSSSLWESVLSLLN